MAHLPRNASDADLLSFVDGWVALMEREDYDSAYHYTEHVPEMKWTPELLRMVVKSYGDAREDQKVTLLGKPTDITQRKKVSRWEPNSLNEIGEVWYDLSIDEFVSDLTATFRVCDTPDGLVIRLNDVHVM
jgi:hypothetical protein